MTTRVCSRCGLLLHPTQYVGQWMCSGIHVVYLSDIELWRVSR